MPIRLNPTTTKLLTHPTRPLTTKMPKTDWNASQYLKFETERTQPALDLLTHIPLKNPKTILDLGCGPATSTNLLARHYPSARITALDSSPAMIERAKAQALHRENEITFETTNIETYTPTTKIDLFYSNAAFQWLKASDRIPTIKRLLERQAPGTVFAMQVPYNLDEPSHALMRETAAEPRWEGRLDSVQRDGFMGPGELYDCVREFCREVQVFEIGYYHSLGSHEEIVEWVKGTGLRPYLDGLDEGERGVFLERYLERLREAYPVSVDGRVLLKYPRLFMVAVK
jgi:trans-aconitate 2-methyltransferase